MSTSMVGNEDTGLPEYMQECFPASHKYKNIGIPTSRQILRIAINLKYLIDNAIDKEYSPEEVLKDGSKVVSKITVKLAYEACGGDQKSQMSRRKYHSVILFALLNVCSWYKTMSEKEIHCSKLYETRGLVTQKLCKIIIEREERENLYYLFLNMLLTRFSINELEKDSKPVNALELATDLHCTVVIGSSGYQRCLDWLWKGWIIQSPDNPKTFVLDEEVSSTNIWSHFTLSRIKTPMYQNYLQILFSIAFLGFYTVVVNGKDTSRVQSLDKYEYVFYTMCFGNILDEVSKFHYIGNAYFSFWNCFNDTLYLIVCASISLRCLSLSPMKVKFTQDYWDMMSYRVLSCAAPFAWSRLLLYLETEKFIGIMLVVVKYMMKESIIFFFLLSLIMIGFFQGFLGLDSSDGEVEITGAIVGNLFATIIGYGDFSVFEDFAAPYAGFLFYGYSFIISVILLNILIALYSNAYQTVVDNADDEYMALMAQKTLRYIRAPDEDVYVPPLNVIELVFSPITKILSEAQSKKLRSFIMSIIYAPMLVVTSVKEVRVARRITYNRLKNLPDDANREDTIWDLTDGYVESGGTLFSDTADFGIRATQIKNRESIQIQRSAELEDCHFSVPESWQIKARKHARMISDESMNITTMIKTEIEVKLEKQNEKIEYLTGVIEKLAEKLDKLKITED